MRDFLNAIKGLPHPEERQRARLEGRTTVMQPLPQFFHKLEKGEIQGPKSSAVAPCSRQGQTLDRRFRGGDGEASVFRSSFRVYSEFIDSRSRRRKSARSAAGRFRW